MSKDLSKTKVILLYLNLLLLQWSPAGDNIIQDKKQMVIKFQNLKIGTIETLSTRNMKTPKWIQQTTK